MTRIGRGGGAPQTWIIEPAPTPAPGGASAPASGAAPAPWGALGGSPALSARIRDFVANAGAPGAYRGLTLEAIRDTPTQANLRTDFAATHYIRLDGGPLGRPASAPPIPAPQSLGPGNLSFPLVGGAQVGDQIAAVSRYIEPTQLLVFDPATQQITGRHDIPTGTGAFGVTSTPNGDVFVGQYGARGEPNLYRLSAETGELEAVAVIDSNLLWDLDSQPDGDVVGVGTQPSIAFRYDAETGLSEDLGIVRPGDSPRAIAATDDAVYVGGRRDGGALLLARDEATGAVQDILPEALRGHEGIYSLEEAGGQLLAGTTGPDGAGPAVMIRDTETGEATVVGLPAHEREVDALALDEATGDVFATARPSGTVYRIPPAAPGQDRTAVPLAMPVEGAETANLSVVNGRVHGASADGSLWTVDRQTGAVAGTDAVAAGATPAPEQPQSITVNGDHVYTAGNFNVGVHDTATGERTNIFLPGEAKDMAVIDGETFFAVYPQGEIWRHRPGEAEATKVADLPPSENRPVSLEVHDGALFVSTASDREGDGGLHRVDPETGALVSAPPLFGSEQWLAGVAATDDAIFVGGGRGGLAALDPETLEPRWSRPALGPDMGALIGLETEGDRLFGFTSRGHLLELDPASGEILRQRQVAPSGGRLVAAGGEIYGVNGDTVFKVDPETFGVTSRPLDPPSENFNFPFLTTDGDDVFVVQGRDVARIPVGD